MTPTFKVDWKDLGWRAFWTFVEGFLIALPATFSLEIGGAAWKSALAAAAMAGLSAVKTMIVEYIRFKKQEAIAAPKDEEE